MATNNIKVAIDFDEDSNLKASFQINDETFHIEISGDEVKKIVPDMPTQSVVSVSPTTTESSGEESSMEDSSKISTPGEPIVASDSESPLAEAVAKVGTTPPSNVSDNSKTPPFTKNYPIVESVLKGLLPFLKSNAEFYKEKYGIKEGEIDNTIEQLLDESYDKLKIRSKELKNSMSDGNRPAAGAGSSTKLSADMKTVLVAVGISAFIENPDAQLLKNILDKIKANKSSAMGMRSAHEKMGAKIYDLIYFIIQTLALDTYYKFITKYDEETKEFNKNSSQLKEKINEMESIPNFNSTTKYIMLKKQEKKAQDKYYRFLKDFKEHLNNSIENPIFREVQVEEGFEESVKKIEQMHNYIESEFNKLDRIRTSHTAFTKARIAASINRAAEKTKSVGKSILSAPGKGLRGIGRFMGYGGKTHKKRSGRGSRTTRKNKYLG